MISKDFFDLVVKMRQAQKNWFKTHNYFYLEQARQLEKQLDKEIERINKISVEPEINFE